MEEVTNLKCLKVGDEIILVGNPERVLSWFHNFNKVVLTIEEICATDDEEPGFYFSYEEDGRRHCEKHIEGTYFSPASWKRNGQIFKVK